MVKTTWIVLGLLMPALVSAITPEELRRLMQEAQWQNAERNARANSTGVLRHLEVETPEEMVVAPAPPESDVTEKSSAALQPEIKQNADVPKPVASQVAPLPKVTKTRLHQPNIRNTEVSSVPNPNTYIPPARYAGQTKAAARSIEVDQRLFGIRIGAWMSGRLTRTVSNADNSTIEIVLTESVEGDYMSLPSGTLLFGSGRFNSGSRRLSVTLTRGLTPAPEHREFVLNAAIHSEDRVSGLAGIVQRNRDIELASAGKTGLAAIGRSLLSKFAAREDVLVEGSSIAVDELLQNEINQIEPAEWTIRVAPQDIRIKVNESF